MKLMWKKYILYHTHTIRCVWCFCMVIFYIVLKHRVVIWTEMRMCLSYFSFELFEWLFSMYKCICVNREVWLWIVKIGFVVVVFTVNCLQMHGSYSSEKSLVNMWLLWCPLGRNEREKDKYTAFVTFFPILLCVYVMNQIVCSCGRSLYRIETHSTVYNIRLFFG